MLNSTLDFQSIILCELLHFLAMIKSAQSRHLLNPLMRENEKRTSQGKHLAVLCSYSSCGWRFRISDKAEN